MIISQDKVSTKDKMWLSTSSCKTAVVTFLVFLAGRALVASIGSRDED